MPLATQETIDRVTNVLLNGNHQMKQAVLRTTPISPPHGDVSMFTNAQLTTGAFGAKLKLAQADDMIRFIKLGPVERDFVGALTFVTQTPAQLPTVASRQGWVPCWFLPWFSGKILKLKISDIATTSVHVMFYEQIGDSRKIFKENSLVSDSRDGGASGARLGNRSRPFRFWNARAWPRRTAAS